MEDDLTHRRLVWKVLSAMYLDTELQDADYTHMARELQATPYTSAEIREIDIYEVFPVLQANLYSPAGVWDAFDEEWLYERCARNYRRRGNALFRFWARCLYLMGSDRRKVVR